MEDLGRYLVKSNSPLIALGPVVEEEEEIDCKRGNGDVDFFWPDADPSEVDTAEPFGVARTVSSLTLWIV